MFFFLMIPPPPRSTLFPYTTLFRSSCFEQGDRLAGLDGERAAGTLLEDPPLELVQRRRRVVVARLERDRSEEHTSELQSRRDLVCRLLLEKKKTYTTHQKQEHSE